eukprot:scaffold109809_cov53-Attheya_sp.AAC.2
MSIRISLDFAMGHESIILSLSWRQRRREEVEDDRVFVCRRDSPHSYRHLYCSDTALSHSGARRSISDITLAEVIISSLVLSPSK